MRQKIKDALKEAMKSKDALRLSTLRLVSAAIKDRDIALRERDSEASTSDDEIRAILARMIKQREASITAYEEGGRLELAERERAEIAVIRTFLPRPLSEDEVGAAIDRVIGEIHAQSLRDMGKVMGALKERYPGQIDFTVVGAQVKSALGA